SRGSTSGNYDISMLNIAAVWDPTSCKASLRQKFDGEPVLLLAASQAEAIAGPGPQASTWDGGKRQALAMLKRLKEYFEFIDLGDDWETGNDI
ncbi:hypothetical protein NL493_28405, partial [Klebsiella pneumoniae]|nr:hypothetical protein [Klebsiella pneumoniae]